MPGNISSSYEPEGDHDGDYPDGEEMERLLWGDNSTFPARGECRTCNGSGELTSGEECHDCGGTGDSQDQLHAGQEVDSAKGGGE